MTPLVEPGQVKCAIARAKLLLRPAVNKALLQTALPTDSRA